MRCNDSDVPRGDTLSDADKQGQREALQDGRDAGAGGGVHFQGKSESASLVWVAAVKVAWRDVFQMWNVVFWVVGCAYQVSLFSQSGGPQKMLGVRRETTSEDRGKMCLDNFE